MHGSLEAEGGAAGSVFTRRRQLARTKRWCTRWQEHPDAIHRFAAIYDEYLLMISRGEDWPSLHVCMRDVIDYHLPRLIEKEYGVFRECDEGYVPHRRLDSESDESRKGA